MKIFDNYRRANTQLWKRLYVESVPCLLLASCRELLRYPPLHRWTSSSHEHLYTLLAIERVDQPPSYKDNCDDQQTIVIIISCLTNPLKGKSTRHQWFPLQRTTKAEFWWFIVADQTVELRLIPYETRLMWRPFNISLTKYIWIYRELLANKCIFDLAMSKLTMVNMYTWYWANRSLLS